MNNNIRNMILYIYAHMYILWCSVAKSCLTLCDPVDCSPTRLLCPWDFPEKNTRMLNGVDCHFLLQWIFQAQGSNPHLLHWQTASLSFAIESQGKSICIRERILYKQEQNTHIFLTHRVFTKLIICRTREYISKFIIRSKF